MNYEILKMELKFYIIPIELFNTYGKKSFDENFIFRAIPLVKFLMGVKFIGL